MTATKPKTARKPRAPKVPDYDALHGAIGLIEAHINRIDHLIEQLKATYRARLSFTGGTYKVAMLGITRTATAGNKAALENWARAARRECLKGAR